MLITEALRKNRNGELKEGEIVKWQGLRNSDTGEIDGGYLYVVHGGKIIGKPIHNARTRAEAIATYKFQSTAEVEK